MNIRSRVYVSTQRLAVVTEGFHAFPEYFWENSVSMEPLASVYILYNALSCHSLLIIWALGVLLCKPRMKKWIRGLLLHGVCWFMQWWLSICVTFQGIDHQLSEWQRCLQSCLTLLQSAVGIFNSVSSREVLDEVVGSVEGKAYLHSKTIESLEYLGYVSSYLVLMISKIIKQKQVVCCHLMTLELKIQKQLSSTHLQSATFCIPFWMSLFYSACINLVG
jgi:hypothetical protein